MALKGLLLENNGPRKGFSQVQPQTHTESTVAVVEVSQTTSQVDSRIGQYCAYDVDLAGMQNGSVMRSWGFVPRFRKATEAMPCLAGVLCKETLKKHCMWRPKDMKMPNSCNIQRRELHYWVEIAQKDATHIAGDRTGTEASVLESRLYCPKI